MRHPSNSAKWRQRRQRRSGTALVQSMNTVSNLVFHGISHRNKRIKKLDAEPDATTVCNTGRYSKATYIIHTYTHTYHEPQLSSEDRKPAAGAGNTVLVSIGSSTYTVGVADHRNLAATVISYSSAPCHNLHCRYTDKRSRVEAGNLRKA